MPIYKTNHQQGSRSMGLALVIGIVLFLIVLIFWFAKPNTCQPPRRVTCTESKDGNLQCIVDNSQVQNPLRQKDRIDIALTNLFSSQGVDGSLQKTMVAEQASHSMNARDIEKASSQRKTTITEGMVKDLEPYKKLPSQVNNASGISAEDKYDVSTGKSKVAKVGGSEATMYGGMDF